MSRAFRAIDLVFSVQANHPPLQALIEDLYADCGTSERAHVHYSIVDRETPDRRSIAIFEDDRRLQTVDDRSVALAYLVWRIGQRAIEDARAGRLLLHAAAAATGGHAVLLSARSGSGKSTLVAGLVAAGFDYLTDDLAPVDLTRLAVDPYPKPIAIVPALLDLFPSARPDPSAREYMTTEAFLTAADLGATAGVRSEARLVVFPEYGAGRPTEVEPVSRAEALVLLAEQSFNFADFGAAAVHALADMLAPCRSVRVRYGELAPAITAIDALLADR